ncbi:MAG TPA: Uma2 family endonuclease [Candidatus Dormibacteraeota bacterium]|nr:Uma2 family endonuclease [Candidatus Dormibacteraeota bacterium]
MNAQDNHPLYLDHPKLIVEVASDSTERVDRNQKRAVYMKIGSLQEYVIVAQDRYEVVVFRRTTGWQSEVLDQPGQVLQLSSVPLVLPISTIYEGIALS